MASNLDLRQTSTIDLSTVADYSVATKDTDAMGGEKENKWINTDFTKYYGFYDSIGEYKSAINSYGTWVIGQGYECLSMGTKVNLDHVIGWGEDTFLSIIWNMIVTKKFAGDSYAEIITDNNKPLPEGKLINLKTLNPSRVAHILDNQGIIKRYEYTRLDGNTDNFEPNEILHFCNDRVVDEPHGTATTKAVEWVIEALQEARRDWKRISHRSTIRVLYVDEDDKTKLVNYKRDYKEAIENGTVLIIPAKKGDAEFQDLNLPPVEAFLAWIRYLENQFYQALGVPKVVLGGTQENTEASAKIGVLVYEPVWTREISELEADLWNQLGIKIKVNKQPSMMDSLQTQEGKNNAQTGFQPNDVQAGVGK